MATRAFVALVPPATVRAEVASLAADLPGLRATPADNVHLTLRFIGDTEDEKLRAFENALERVRVESFILPVAGVGLFPGRGPAKVLWAGVGTGHPRLHQLRKQVDEALLSVDSGLAVPGFHAHFTVGRLTEPVDPKKISRFLEQQQNFEAPPFRVSEFQLLASELRPGRPPAYRTVRSFGLA